MEEKNKLVLLHLSLISGIGPVTTLKIVKKIFDNFCRDKKNACINKFNLDLTEIYKYNVHDFVNLFELQENRAQLLIDGLKEKELLEKELSLIKKYKIKIITFLNADYPAQLKEIYSPPLVLYCRGKDLTFFDKKLAIVGTRKSSDYALKVLNSIVPDIVSSGYTIVSGGALGVDTIAHKIATEAGGKTIVVLGSGLLNPYPTENKNLFRKIILEELGCLISPFPLSFPIEKSNFPARNRIIAGLCSGCLVVQAAQKSGALITAQFALDEGRQVFAIPGPIDDELSFGCNYLIKNGAKLVATVDDILEEFGETFDFKSDSEINFENGANRKKEIKEIKDKKDTGELILDIICSQSVMSIDDLSIKTGIDLNLLQDLLFQLQLDGKIKQNFAGFWQKI